jgi:SpoIVB peptidase S55
MKILRNIACINIIVWAFSTSLVAQTNPKFMPVDEVRAGMKGIGKTVFKGTTIEDFNVEILGVLKDSIAPKQDMILCRLSGGPLDQTGVIAGMSGSPVFIDGRLVGAVAYSFPFAKEPIAGIQPIEQMVNLLDFTTTPAIQPARASITFPSMSPREFISNMIEQAAAGRPLHELLLPQSMWSNRLATTGNSLVHIETPVLLSGITQAAIQHFAPFFSAFGLSPAQAGGSGSVPVGAAANTKLEPGSSVNIEMIRGDFNYSANGTVTYVDGDKVYAFGHPNLGAGSTDLPMAPGYVITVLPNMQNSFKLAVPLDVIGAFKQDRNTGIAGQVGDQPRMIPVTLTLKSSTNAVNKYNFEIANDRFLTPLLMNFSIFNSITASERALGEMTLAVTGTIHLKDKETVNIGNIFTGDMNGPAMASIAAIAPVQYLMTTGYDGTVIQKIDLEIVSTERKSAAQLEGITVDKTEVRPGETINLTAFLRATSGDSVVERYPVQIPAGLPAGSVQLLVGDGTTITSTELRRGAAGAPQDLNQVIRELNKLRKNDRLYIKILSNEPGVVIGGEEMPSLPPSMSAVLNTNRSSNRSVSNMGNSTVREYELPQSKYVIQGQRSLNLTVLP